jgi:acyl-CoA dehydrogenase
MVALQSVWSAEFAVEWAIEHCCTSGHNGNRLSNSQAVQFALAEMASEVTIGKTFVHKLVADHMEKKNIVKEAPMAKLWTSDLSKRITGRVLELIGAHGARKSCPVSRTWRDVQVNSIFAGTNEIMKTIIAKQILK